MTAVDAKIDSVEELGATGVMKEGELGTLSRGKLQRGGTNFPSRAMIIGSLFFSGMSTQIRGRRVHLLRYRLGQSDKTVNYTHMRKICML